MKLLLKIIVAGLVIGISAGADTYDELIRANSLLRGYVEANASRIDSSPAGRLRQMQSAAFRGALSTNDGSATAVKTSDPATSLSPASTGSTTTPAGGSTANSTSTPKTNQANAIQTLQLPKMEYDTSVKDDASPYLKALQDQVIDLTKALAEPTVNRNYSTTESIDKEIADIQQASDTRIMLMRAEAAFALATQKEQDARRAKAEKSITDELHSLDDARQSSDLFGHSIPVLTPQSGRAPGSKGHFDTLTPGKSASFTPDVTRVPSAR